jgi:hypothetical protein
MEKANAALRRDPRTQPDIRLRTVGQVMSRYPKLVGIEVAKLCDDDSVKGSSSKAKTGLVVCLAKMLVCYIPNCWRKQRDTI